MTLGEAGTELLGTKATGIVKELNDSFKAGGAALIDPDLTRRMLRANVNLSMPIDVDEAMISKLLQSVDNVLHKQNVLKPSQSITDDIQA